MTYRQRGSNRCASEKDFEDDWAFDGKSINENYAYRENLCKVLDPQPEFSHKVGVYDQIEGSEFMAFPLRLPRANIGHCAMTTHQDAVARGRPP